MEQVEVTEKKRLYTCQTIKADTNFIKERPKGNYYIAWQKRKQKYGKTGSKKPTVNPSTVNSK